MADKHRARKRFGQNFLTDDNIIAQIAHVIRAERDDKLVEIGPGKAALTRALLPDVDSLDVIEIDRDLIAGLEKLALEYPALHVHCADVLKFDMRSLLSENERHQKLRVIGNLPYNISTPIMFHLLANSDIIQDMHFMLQKEVVERMAAAPGCSDYGRLTIMVQYQCQVENLFLVPPYAFNPQPKVDSAIVRLTPHAELPVKANDEVVFKKLVTKAFTQRRKTLRNAIKDFVDAEKIQSLDIDPTRRPETLSVSEYVALSNLVN